MKIAFFALALLVLAPMFSSGQAAPVPTPPSPTTIAVTGVGLQGAAPYWRDTVAHDGTVVTSVKNTGSTATSGYSIAYQWQANDGTLSWLDGDGLGQAGSTDVDTGGALPAGATRQHTFPWHLQPGQEGNGVVVVTATQSNTPSSASMPVFVAVHLLGVAVAPREVALAAEESGFFRLLARNDGNVPEAMDLAVTDAQRGANARLRLDLLHPHLALLPGATANADLVLDYPFVDSGDFTANYTVRATASTNFILKTPLVHVHDCCAATGQSFRADLMTANLFTLSPGQQLRVPLRVVNLATGGSGLQDTYRVGGGAPDGFAVDADPPRLALLEGEAGYANVTLTVPGGAAEGSSFTATFRVTSDHGATQSFPVTVRVRGAAFTVQSVQADLDQVYVGDQARATVTVKNIGNQDSASPGVLHVTATLPGATVAYDQQLPPIAAGATSIVTLHLGPLQAAGAGAVGACWRRADDPAGCSPMESTFEARDFNVEVRAPAGLSGQPGEGVSYQAASHAFQVINHGALAEELSFMPFASNGTVQLSDVGGINLGPGELLSVPMVHVLPSLVGELTNATLGLTVSPMRRPDLQVKNTTTTAIYDLLPPVISDFVVPENWTLGEPLPITVAIADGSRVAAANLTVVHPDGSTAHLVLVESAPGTWTGRVDFAAVGDHGLSLTAWDAFGNLAETDALTVHVSKDEPPTVATIDLPESVAANATVLLQVTSTHPLASLQARLDDGPPVELNVSGSVARLHLTEFADVAGGSHNVTVEALDNAGGHSKLTFTLLVQNAQVTVASAPPTRPASAWGVLGVLAALALARGARRGPPR